MALARVFARVAGWFGLLLALIGFTTTDLFGMIQFDMTHNIVHFVFGFLGIAAASKELWTRYYAYIFGAFYVLFGVLGFFLPTLHHVGVELEVTENLLHLALGTFGVYAALGLHKKQPPKTEE